MPPKERITKKYYEKRGEYMEFYDILSKLKKESVESYTNTIQPRSSNIRSVLTSLRTFAEAVMNSDEAKADAELKNDAKDLRNFVIGCPHPESWITPEKAAALLLEDPHADVVEVSLAFLSDVAEKVRAIVAKFSPTANATMVSPSAPRHGAGVG
jgi:TPP-dependent indolepyruvate ferredoxin oxidoreductase alpha subunit